MSKQPVKKKGGGKRKKLTESEKAQIRSDAWMEVGRLECEIIASKWYQILYRHWCRQKIRKIKAIYRLK